MKTKEELEKETQELYDKLMEKFGSERGNQNRRKFPTLYGKVNKRIYAVSEFTINVLNGREKVRDTTIDICKRIYNLEVEKSEDIIYLFKNVISARSRNKFKSEKKQNLVKPRTSLDDVIAEQINSIGLINTISEVENILESLREKRNVIQDRTREIDLEIEKLTKEKESQISILMCGKEKQTKKRVAKGSCDEEIRELFRQGLSAGEIRKRGFTSSTIYRIRKEFKG